MNLHSIDEAIQIAQTRWPGYEFHAKNSEEACGPCPFEQAGRDRFLIWINGHYWCRQCSMDGWLDDDQQHVWTPEEIRLRRIEAEQMRQRRKQAELERRLSALERMARCTDHLIYHDNLDERTFGWWLEQGMWPQTILDYTLGFCPHCPTDRQHRPSYTLPIWDHAGRALWNIRHRLDGETSDKYRPHIAGLGQQLSNVQALNDAEYAIILEGAKKALVCHQYGFPTVGVMGKRGIFKGEWLQWFPDGPIYVALDPDAQENAEELAHGLAQTGRDARVARFPLKPDDLFLAGGTAEDFSYYLNLAKGIH